jgi:hypothetical protein
MNNSDSIREFFRRMADGSAAKAPRFDMLHNTSGLMPRHASNESFESVMFYASERDHGIGLPPLANC